MLRSIPILNAAFVKIVRLFRTVRQKLSIDFYSPRKEKTAAVTSNCAACEGGSCERLKISQSLSNRKHAVWVPCPETGNPPVTQIMQLSYK